MLRESQAGAEDVHETMNEVAEALEDQSEIEAALATPVGGGIQESESDLLAELEELVRQDEAAQTKDILGQAPRVPSAPLPVAEPAVTSRKQFLEYSDY